MPTATTLDATTDTTDWVCRVRTGASDGWIDISQSPTGHPPAGVTQWVMRPAVRVSASACRLTLLGLGGVFALIAGGFWYMGAPWVMPFAVLELTALGVAMGWFVRRSADTETVTLHGRQLWVMQRRGASTRTFDMNAAWTRVSWGESAEGWIELACATQRIRLGRHLSASARQVVARDICRALRQAV